MTLSGAIDYWCNAFTPDRQSIWERMVGDQGIPLKVIREDDGFCSAEEMVSRLESTGFASVILVAADLAQDGATLDGFEQVAVRPAEIAALASEFSGRFVATWSIDPTSGMSGVRRAAEMLDTSWCVGLHSHTHSWDRPFDHADYYPYYALCADNDVPFVMQAGTSGGRFPSECGRPIGIDRPAIYFPTVRFVLSHLGWPWTTEAIAMSLKFANVYLGTATYPPRRWPDELYEFLTGVGRTKVLYGSGFPTSGHVQAAAQIPDLGLDSNIVARLIRETAQSVFTRIQPTDRSGA